MTGADDYKRGPLNDNKHLRSHSTSWASVWYYYKPLKWKDPQASVGKLWSNWNSNSQLRKGQIGDWHNALEKSAGDSRYLPEFPLKQNLCIWPSNSTLRYILHRMVCILSPKKKKNRIKNVQSSTIHESRKPETPPMSTNSRLDE